MIYAVLLAGGTGTRMKTSKVPKQFIELGGEPILRLTVEKFLMCPKVDHVIVAAPAIWIGYTKELLKDSRFADIRVCEGGSTRQESLYNAVRFIGSVFPIAEDDIIVSHDVARPFVSLRVIEENIDALDEFGAAATVMPATDTIVESDDGRCITCIRDRSRMYQAQTPQTFRRKDYIRIYGSLSHEYLERVTDAARILSENGVTVALVRGDETNMKITTDHDLTIAAYFASAGA
ncbi:MAG: 2-C-methyl-D-erythritol 4-phosphate cytidylyltransferase [Mailhella sp.]|nr:2-C-methyl-D-erythritol 4-phosphate cytidylyltransferase [Mailhella sp.]